MAKTSLEKSHSKISNFKLTLIIILFTLFISVFWFGIYILTNNDTTYQNIGIIVTIVGLLFSIFNFILIDKFTR